MSEPLRVVTWRAVSTEDQVERESLHHQEEVNKEHVARIGGVVVASLHVDGQSRAIDFWEDAVKALDAYRELDILLKKRPRSFDVLMCYDLSRVARTDSLMIALAKKLERAGVRIYECTSPSRLDGPISTPDSRLMLLVRAHQYDQEVRKFAERSYFGRKARVAKGKLTGKPPFGYQRVYDERGISYCVIEENDAAIVRLFYDLYLNHGRSLNSICAEFKARGYVSPQSKNPYVPGNLNRLLKNRWAYAGYASWGTTINSNIPENEKFRVAAEWEPIITVEMALKAEKELERRVIGPRSVSGYRRFSCVARCAYCGATVIGKHSAGHNGYIDDRYSCRFSCHGGTIGDRQMTSAVRDFILSLDDEEVFNSLIEDTPDQLHTLIQNKEDAEKALDQIKNERKNLTRAFTREVISLSEYEDLMRDHQEQMDMLMRRIAQLDAEIQSTPTAESRRKRLEDIRERGIAMLEHPDAQTASAWLRSCLVLYVRDRRVVAIEVL